MSVQSRYPKGETVFEHWKVEKHLGGGSNGKTAVFVLSHASSHEIHSALKIVNLITEEGTVEECSPFQRQEFQRARESCTDTAIQEVLLMSGLQGQPNIVGYLDHAVVDWQEEDCFGRDLLIRMELLTDLRRLMLQGKVFSEEEVVRIGTDICKALSVCHQKNILHRDIKPENIFVNADGVYKLGDFGISRILDSAAESRASTGIGTPQYAAPEQFSLEYDKRADLYSLGLVLYELRNGNRLPFTDAAASMPEYVRRRLSGEAFPELKSTSPELSAAIFRACRFQPEERFSTAEDFARALHSQDTGEITPMDAPKTEDRKPGSRKPLLWGIPAVCVLILAFVLGMGRVQNAPVQPDTMQAAPTEGTIAPTEGIPAPEGITGYVDDSQFTYDFLTDGSIIITGYAGEPSGELVLPGEIQGKPVSVIGSSAFENTDIRRVTIPEGVVKIEPWAFLDCENLEEIRLPDSLKTIEMCAFLGCRQLKQLQLPEGLTTIGENAFNYSGITTLAIPASVTRMEDTFLACDGLTDIQVARDNPNYSSQDGVLFDKEKTVLLRYPAARPADTYRVPRGVTVLGENAFESAMLDALELPGGLESVEEDCFYLAQMKSLTIPASVHYIAEGAISSCPRLESILVETGNKSYASRDGVLYSGDGTVLLAFPHGRKGDFTIPDTVAFLGKAAFFGSRLSRIEIPDSVKSIPKNCFSCCYVLTGVTLPEGLADIQEGAFTSCTGLSFLELPKTVSHIGRYAFGWCTELKSVTVPNPDCVIEEQAFPEDCRIIR